MTPSSAQVQKQIRSQVDEVDPAEVRRQIGNGAVLIDVRENEEFAAGHIPGAAHVPRSYLESRIEGAAPVDVAVFLQPREGWNAPGVRVG